MGPVIFWWKQENGVAGSTEHQHKIARRTCHGEEMDLELKQQHCHMEEEVCDKNNMKPSKR